MSDADRWFATIDNHTLCRAGGNGPINVSQIMPLVTYVNDGDSFLDIGCGSAATLDALKAIKKQVIYKGTDFIEHRVAWLKKTFPEAIFEVGDARKIQEEDKSWDVVWSRHVIDHLGNFEQFMNEQCRVSKRYVICILWMEFTSSDEHLIKPIIDGGKTYEDEWTNQYSRKLVQKYLADKCREGWNLQQFIEHVTWNGSQEGKGRDTIIVLQRV